VIARTSLLRRLGGYRLELPHTADFELWMRLAAYADVGFVRGSHQAYYRRHPNSMQQERFAAVLADLTQMAAAFEVFFRDHRAAIADGARLEAMARRMLAKRVLLAACRAYDRGEPPLSEVAALEKLAHAIDSGIQNESEQRGLRWRKALGAQACRLVWPLLPPSVVPRLVRRIRRALLRRAGM
jgi:hypothetical protein